MTDSLRDVRPTRGFYADLHRQLPAERGEDGTPSRVDFELYDLVDILNTFARPAPSLGPWAIRARTGLGGAGCWGAVLESV